MHINELSQLLLTKHHPTVELVEVEQFRLKSEELMRLGNVLRMDPAGSPPCANRSFCSRG